MAYNEHKSESQNNYGWNLTWNATGKFPVIAKRIWKTKADLLAWVNDISDTAVEGLIVGVCGDGENNGVYFLESVGDGLTDGSVVQLVKKEKGKGLSTNDFTDEYKNKLDSYNAETEKFDDTAIWERIEALATALETLTSENVDSTIESFNEIVTFLSNIEDTHTLEGIINGINQSISNVEKRIPTKLSELDNDMKYLTEHQDLSGKQDKLVSGTNIKTINGQDVLGEGDIVIEGGNSEANVGAVDTDDFVEEPDLAKYLTTKPQSFTDEEKQQVKDNLGISETGGNVETLNVNVSGITEGFTVYVMSEDGNVIGSQTTNYKTYRIKEGTRYYVMAGEVEGYMAPNNSETFTAYGYAEHEINMVYKKYLGTKNPSNGVYIQDIYGYCCTEDEWTGDFTPNGIAVITDNCSFVIALEQSSELLYFGPNDVVESGVVTTNESGALGDYKGVNNTNAMVDRYPTKNYSCNYCKSYIFPNGKTGYLGAAGEWNMVSLNFDAIVRALEICGGQPFITEYPYTSSTLSNTNSGLKHVWVFNLNSRVMYYSGKDNRHSCRAFTTL